MNTLICTEVVEFAGPEILGAFNATEKLGNLLGGRPDKNLHLTENIFEEGKTSSGATSVSEHHRDNAAVKAAAHSEKLNFLAP